MKTRFSIILLLIAGAASAQEIRTVFGDGRVTGGYGALTNQFTTIRGEFANLAGVYGGVFINRRWMLGLSFTGSTNDIQVPLEYSANPLQNMTYQYAQGGLLMERVIGSNKPIHLVLSLFSGAGYTMQYSRDGWDSYYYDPNDYHTAVYDENWFYVIEPGAQLEMNLFRWMRLSPGISYRQTYESKGLGLSDHDLSDWTYSVTLKFGGFGRRDRSRSSESLN